MASVRFKYSKSDGTPASGMVVAKPTRRHESDDRVVLPTAITISIGSDGEATADLAPTNDAWVWEINELLHTTSKSIVYVVVPDESGPLDFTDLEQVDPRTLQPSAKPGALWWAALEENNVKSEKVKADAQRAETARDAAEGALEESVTVLGQTFTDLEIRDDNLWGVTHDGSEVDLGSVIGPRGPQGGQGPQGEQGVQGDQGEMGDAGTIAVGDVQHGETAEVVNSGNDHNAVFDFTLPRGERGPQGDRGPQGSQGDQGETGDSASVSIGEVTHGDSASVENTGTPLDAVLDFILPRGEQGPRGVQGEQGDQGPRGEKGDVGEGLEIVGTLESSDELPDIGDVGNAYLIEGHLWVWTDGEWIDTGNLQGPKGDQGDQGERGPRGQEGPRGPEGPQGPDGTVGDAGNGHHVDAPVTDWPQGVSIAYTNSSDMEWARLFDQLGLPSVNTVNVLTIRNFRVNHGDTGMGSSLQFIWQYNRPHRPMIKRGWIWSQDDRGGWADPEIVAPKGDKGDKGDTGDTGPRGSEGPQGPKGDTGATGPVGDTGSRGPAGADGTDGEDGARGAEGPQGPQGEPGPKGDTGDRGPQGPAGDIPNVDELRIAQVAKLQGLDEFSLPVDDVHVVNGYDNSWSSGDKLTVSDPEIIVQETGWYNVVAQCRFGFHGVGNRAIYIVVNNSDEIAYTNIGATNNATVIENADSGPVLLQAGDRLDMRVQHTFTGQNSLPAGGAKASANKASDQIAAWWIGHDG